MNAMQETRSAERPALSTTRDSATSALEAVKTRFQHEEALKALVQEAGKRLPVWPSVTASTLGTGVVAGSMIAETVLDSPFATAEYVVTILVGAVLMLVGPLIVAVDQEATRKHSTDALGTLKDLDRQLAELDVLRQRDLS